MFIRQVLSYGNAWERLSTEYQDQLQCIKYAIGELTPDRVSKARAFRPVSLDPGEPIMQQRRLDWCWLEIMREMKWELPTHYSVPIAGRRLSLRNLGHVFGPVSLRLFRHREFLNRWLYTTAPMGARAGVIDIPVALVLNDEAQESLLHRISSINSGMFEMTRDELLTLSPLSHAAPFVIIEVSAQDEELSIIDLGKEEGVAFRQVVVNRSIEFPRQYHQAGLGVLTYFGTVLREKYPNHDAKVRIEQDGLKVRLIIESQNGDREVIEKALQEYELVVLGEKSPESLLSSAAAVIELKSELRIAQVRIESQRDIIALQGAQISTLSQLIGHSLTRDSTPVNVAVSPIIRVSSSANQCVDLTTSIPDVSEDVRELLALSTDVTLRSRLLDLSEALEVASNRITAADIRKSSGVAKLRSFIEEAFETGSKLNSALEKLERGVELLQELGRKYNAIAEWCGAPQIPKAILGKGC